MRCSRRRSSCLTLLRIFLSRSNLASSTPHKHTVNTLKSLYTSIKTRSQLAQLGSGRITTLINLLGSLSLSSSKHLCVNDHGSLSNTDCKPLRSYWTFVLMMAKDKERLGKYLSNLDRYWVMRAELANARDSHGESRKEGESLINCDAF